MVVESRVVTFPPLVLNRVSFEEFDEELIISKLGTSLHKEALRHWPLEPAFAVVTLPMLIF